MRTYEDRPAGGRRLLPLVVAGTLLVGCGGDGSAPDATTTTSGDTSTTAVEPSVPESTEPGGVGLGAACTFDAAGWTIEVRYPEAWETNEEAVFDHGTVPACRLFDPDDATPPRPNELTGFGVILYVDAVAFEADRSAPLDAEVLAREERTVSGRAAVRREDRLTEGGIRGPAGARVTLYRVDLDGSILVATTAEVADLDYEANRDVLDAMMDAVVIEPAAS